MISHLPNALTWARIVMIPLVLGVYFLPDAVLPMPLKNLVACGLFVLAAVTDWFDGYLARRLGITSAFGAFLDPVADKLMVCAALVLLVWLRRCDVILAFIIIGRELTISALREWMAQLGKSRSVAVSFIGKLKTFAQMTAIPMLLFQQDILGLPVSLLGEWLMWVAAILTLWSMAYYMNRALKVLAEA
ncbi:MAG: CDP-diacylglycerol--glycerol-3-phosphate 3-phosphatidyltransferase [Candidatus Dactylopiibacterium carminicum]|uniref:CDP-diacylglycerol--glycerol-3-phosphate 3-phosphatidyltransferase n=1 Tax=Candidatus Dactylopiibacterium carminicum TaxID=857335 RepID=A0A272EXB5_9RHOO|nr:CDP-diacylglycerol--glycerol-3-phosphate 3-phosphatidyltransferase [Candidatus Dactylopiibacterium carminicum]KAF7600218.1 CDP-diacylglycerol--glycerol-3-phosphate 3-phosphatidyltransferase [Candidatus Dactylopiibacterium carminicum]PAS94764.1 MAG: CDP-diacylglycerol--glycerol-3-phosphate 3-phosphatidyltransferase [Candidatus Dactylopiibacterium carminicum]PAS97689.1 MAG: CDP-diacylglycerol--glycerol-3-phosphate 3-phosphatidyltransferase [Candidatus Dactylopiibacterium carminicum]PAT00214.1 